jgi:hypothetical protein
MSEEKTMTKRDQVLEMLNEGTFTREQIAEKLAMPVASVSSQFTYLRWMGNYIIYNEDKIVRTATKEMYDAWVAERAANKKTSTRASAKSPQDQADALAKTLANWKKLFASWGVKLKKIDADLITMPDDDELQELRDEAAANTTLLGIKIKRGEKKALTLPEPLDEATENEEVEEAEETEDGEGEDLL